MENFPKGVETTVEKGEIALYKLFLLFPQCFKQNCTGVTLTLYSTDTHFNALTTAFGNIVGIEEIARNKQFLLFPQCFLLKQKTVSPFVNIFDIISLSAVESKEPEIAM